MVLQNSYKDFSWTSELIERALPLDDAYIALQGTITSAVDWYLRKKAGKRLWARTLRFLTILAVVLGGLVPIVSAVWVGLPSAIGFVLFGLAAGMQLMDRSFGFSEGWSRSLRAAMGLEACGAKLALEFSHLKAQAAEDDKMWQLLIAASNELWRIIGSETSNWASEFESALDDIRKRSVQQSDGSTSGGARGGSNTHSLGPISDGKSP